MRGFCKLVLLAAERQTTDGTAAEVETGDRDLRRDKIGRVRYLRSSIRCSTRTRTNERTRMPAHVDGWMDACMHGAPTHARTAAAKAYVAVAATPGRGSKMNHLESRKGPDFSRHHQQRAFFESRETWAHCTATHTCRWRQLPARIQRLQPARLPTRPTPCSRLWRRWGRPTNSQQRHMIRP